MSRERDVRQAVVDLLTATDQFDHVSLGASDPTGIPASDLKLATVDPQNSQIGDLWDGAPDGDSIVDCTIVVTVSVRSPDPKVRDDEAERLLNVVRNALNGQRLAGLTWCDFTKVKSWSWRTATADQRDVVCQLRARYGESGWDDADVLD